MNVRRIALSAGSPRSHQAIALHNGAFDWTSNPEHPDRDDRADRRQAADGPAGRVNRFVVTRAAHHFGSCRCCSPVHFSLACARRRDNSGHCRRFHRGAALTLATPLRSARGFLLPALRRVVELLAKLPVHLVVHHARQRDRGIFERGSWKCLAGHPSWSPFALVTEPCRDGAATQYALADQTCRRRSRITDRCDGTRGIPVPLSARR
jgi:hypothetical protein